MRTRRFWGAALGCALLLATTPLPSSAQSEEPEEKMRVSVLLYGGPQSYSMSEVNREIESDNEVFEDEGFSIDQIKGGFGFGAGIRLAPSRRLSFQFDYNRLAAKSNNSGLLTGNIPVEVKLSLPANGFLLTAAYYRQWHAIHYGIGAGPGYYICSGDVNQRLGAQNFAWPVKGSGFGFHVLGLADIGISSHLRFEFGLGYRSAKTGNLRVGETDLVLEDGSTVKADWSGMTSRFGFSIPFDPGTYPEAR